MPPLPKLMDCRLRPPLLACGVISQLSKCDDSGKRCKLLECTTHCRRQYFFVHDAQCIETLVVLCYLLDDDINVGLVSGSTLRSSSLGSRHGSTKPDSPNVSADVFSPCMGEHRVATPRLTAQVTPGDLRRASGVPLCPAGHRDFGRR